MKAPLVGIAGLAAFVTYCFCRREASRQVKTEVKEDLRRWEGEGGNVPAVATPSPAPVPQMSHPTAGSDARH